MYDIRRSDCQYLAANLVCGPTQAIGKYITRTLNMTQQVIDIGNVANDGQGDPLRTAFQKTNANFTELYNIGGITGIANGTSNIAIVEDATVSISAANVANVFVVSGTGATNQGLLLSNTISATGNVTVGGFYFGNGSQLTGVISSAPAALITGTTLSSNVTTSTLTSVGVLTNLSVAGNVIGGNLRTSGELSASGNINGQNINTGGAVAATGNITGGNVNTDGQISVTGNINSGGRVTAASFVGDGSGLTGFTVSSNAALLTGSLLSANVVNSSLQTLGTLSSLVVNNALGGNGAITANSVSVLGGTISATGAVTGGNVVSLGFVNASGAGIFGGDITGGNITGNLTDGNVAANNLNATTRVSGAIISASGNITGANVNAVTISASGNVIGNLLLGTIATAAQPSITTVGTLGSLTVTANITGGNINTGGVVSAAGNISGLNLGTTGAVSAGTVSASGNITGGNIMGGANVNATTHTGTTVSVTGNIDSGNLRTGGQITATGNITGANTTITGNLIATGTAGYLNSTTVAFTDPIPSVGRGANNTGLISATNTDVGSQLYYFDTSERSAFVGYQLSTGNMVIAKAATISNELITVNTYGNVVVGTVLAQGDVSAVGNVRGGNAVGFDNVDATTHTGTTVSVTGNITGGNILGGANVIATTHTGTTVSVTGNVTGGNVISAAAISGTGLTISGNTATVTSANYQIGYRDLPQITTFTTLVADAGGKHYFGSGTITIPTNASVPFAIGTAILVIASGATTISPAAGVTLTQAGSGATGARTLATSGQASLVKVGTNTWYISGVGIS